MTQEPTNCSAFCAAGRLLPVLLPGFLLAACAPELRPIDRILRSVQRPEMRERWRKAEAGGQLPPIEAIPEPKRRVAVRRPITIKPPIRPPARRPIIPVTAIAGAQPFSPKPIARYEGAFRVTQHKPGVLVGMVQRGEEPFELHYRLPPPVGRQLAIPQGARLQLSLRDEVVGSALQRRVILRTAAGTTPFAQIAEGSNERYRTTLKEIQLLVEQQPGQGNPPVKVTYAGNTAILKQGETRRLGAGAEAVEVYLLTSIARDPRRARLQEGQPFYVNIMLYRPR